MLQSQLVLGVISFLSTGRDCFWRAHKLADGFSVTRFETPSLLVKRFWFLISLWTKRLESNPRFQEINKNAADNWWKGPWKSASIVAVSWSISLCERGSRRKRIWGQRRMRLGAEADASGGRGGCRRGEVRWQVGNLCLRSIGGAATSLVWVASSLSAPFGKRIQTVKRRICIPTEHFKYNANWEQSIKHKFAWMLYRDAACIMLMQE